VVHDLISDLTRILSEFAQHCGQILHGLLLVELYVKYYRDLEMWVRGHSKSLKMVPFESLGTVSYLPSIVTMAVSVAILEIYSIKKWPDLEIWV